MELYTGEFYRIDCMDVFGEKAECEICGKLIEKGFTDGDLIVCRKCYDEMEDGDTFFHEPSPAPRQAKEPYNPCEGCGGEDCVCCSVWLEQQ